MKITCLLGSPRPNGNSSYLASRFCAGAEKRGATVSVFPLNKLAYKGCQGCMACKTKLEKCVLQDGLTDVLAAAAETDVLVLATPVYFGEITAQLKAFVDRTFSWFTPDFLTSDRPSRLAPGKKLVLIQVQGQPDPAFYADIWPRYETFLKMYGFGERRLFRACGLHERGDAEKDAALLARLDALVDEVVK